MFHSSPRLQAVAVRSLAVGALLTTLSIDALAGGFQLNEHSAAELGRAFTGHGLSGDDASSVFYNPAAMRYVDQPLVQAATTVISTSGRFENTGSSQQFGPIVVPSRGPDDSGGTTSLVPSLSVVQPVSDRVTLGVGVSAPFGLRTKYDSDWVGRYHAVESELITFDFNPSASVQITERLSLGAGLSAQYGDVTLSRAVFVPGASDGFVELKGDDWAFGYNFGVAYSIGERLRVGASFRSKVRYEFDGRSRLTGVAGGTRTQDVDADIELPESVYLASRAELASRWSVSMAARWTRWSRFDEIRVRFADGSPDDVTPERWQDSWTVGAGVDFQWSDRWSVAAGYAYDETPVPSADLRTPRIPDADRQWVSLGLSFKPNERWALRLSAAHLFVDDVNLDVTVDLLPATLAPSGTFTDRLIGSIGNASAEIASLQIDYRFAERE